MTRIMTCMGPSCFGSCVCVCTNLYVWVLLVINNAMKCEPVGIFSMYNMNKNTWVVATKV